MKYLHHGKRYPSAAAVYAAAATRTVFTSVRPQTNTSRLAAYAAARALNNSA